MIEIISKSRSIEHFHEPLVELVVQYQQDAAEELQRQESPSALPTLYIIFSFLIVR
jgi:hypothetical protein